MTNLTRRAAITTSALIGAYALTATRAAAVTNDDTYHPTDATINAIGAGPDGWADTPGVGPAWDDNAIAAHNMRDTENRAIAMHRHHRDSIDTIMRAVAPPTTTLKIMCVGDSITVGAGSTSPGGTYNQYYLGDGPGYLPWLTSTLLRARIDAQLTSVAEGGQMLRQMGPRAIQALPTVKPDIVIMHIGTNDIDRDETDWTTRYGQTIDAILTSSPTVKFIGTLLPHYRQPSLDAGTTRINSYITTAINARKGTGRVTTADLRGLTPHWTGDGYHPLEAGHLHTAEQYAGAIRTWY